MSTARSDERLPRARSAGVPGCAVRAMLEDDLPAVLDIERRAYDFPWSERIFTDCIRVSYHCRVVEDRGEVVGYSVMTAGAGEAHVLNLCIVPERRRHGLARALLSRLMDEARMAGARIMLLEVRPSNTAAITLYESLGFGRIGRRKDYYPDRDGREDAVVMSKKL